MIYKYKHIISLFALCAILPACSDNDVFDSPSVTEKTPIELSVGGMDVSSPSLTRAVITDGTGKTLQAFAENTSLYMLMKSECVDAAHNHAVTAHNAKVTRTIMFALPQTENSKDYSEVNYSASNEESKFVRYWEDSYSRSSALSILAVCTPGMGPGGSNTKSWTIGNSADYANQSWTQINGDANYPTVKWPIGNDNQINGGNLLTDQSGIFDGVSFIKNQDLCFSNNIGKHGEINKRLQYDFVNNKRFPRPEDKWDDNSYKTRMIFYHALSKLTFQIKKDGSFTDANFTFDKETVDGVQTNTNIKLTNFYNSGTFNIEEGEFTNTTSNDIKRIYQHPSLTNDETTADYKYILDALVIPGTEMNDAGTTGVVFKIAGNEYKLSMKQLYDAIITNPANSSISDWSKYFDKNSSDVYSILKPGVHYVFTLTVGKTKIQNITAQLAPWETVESTNFFPDNSFVNLSLLTANGTKLEDGVDFYRGLNLYNETDLKHDWQSYDWQTYNWTTTNAYEKPTSAQYKEASGTTPAHWETDWFWDSNRHFYHFRAIVPSGQTINSNTGSSANPTVSLEAKQIKSKADTYTDVMWGAPFLSTTNKLTYSVAKGFDGKGAENTTNPTHQIHWAIGPTKDEIKLVTFHLMSEVTINIQTSTDGSADHVLLGDGTDSSTRVELLGCASSGTANVGDGCVTPGATVATQILADNISSTNQSVSWGVIPQSLEGKKLRIVTPDNNEYIVDLADVEVSTPPTNNISTNNLANPYQETTSGSGKYKIDYWYPNYKYTYTFTLLKMGIANLSATYVDWETVTAAEETVQIK